jgi:transposase
MANGRLSVRKIKEILRLKLDYGISEREISRSCQVSLNTAADYLRRAAAAKLTRSEASALAEVQLEERLFPTEHIPSTVKHQNIITAKRVNPGLHSFIQETNT